MNNILSFGSTGWKINDVVGKNSLLEKNNVEWDLDIFRVSI